MAASDGPGETSNSHTLELAWELQQPKPDTLRIRWLMETGADIETALAQAELKEEDLRKKPALRPFIQDSPRK